MRHQGGWIQKLLRSSSAHGGTLLGLVMAVGLLSLPALVFGADAAPAAATELFNLPDFAFEDGSVLFPAATVAHWNGSPVPAVGPEEFLRVDAAVLRRAARHEGETAVLVLLPIPLGGELDEALEPVLPPPQFLVRAVPATAHAVLAMGSPLRPRPARA